MTMNVHDRLKTHGLIMGRAVTMGSKTGYRKRHPDSEVYFNANIFTSEGKVWWGDIDVTVSGDILQAVADESGETLYLLRETDGRWENETRPFEEVKRLAVKTYVPAKRDMFDVVDSTVKK